MQRSGAGDGQRLDSRPLLHLQHPVTVVHAPAEDHVVGELAAGHSTDDNAFNNSDSKHAHSDLFYMAAFTSALQSSDLAKERKRARTTRAA